MSYGSESPALAVLEVLVHLQSVEMLPSYSLASAEVPDALIELLDARDIPPGWKELPAPPETQVMGDEWVRARRSAVLRVPSAIVESSYNYLLNPAHPSFPAIIIGKAQKFEFDSRLWRPR